MTPSLPPWPPEWLDGTGRIRAAILSDIRGRNRMSSLVSAATSLTRKGPSKYLGLCPIHQEKTPSCWVDDAKGTLHCFGCGAHMNAFDWVRWYLGYDFQTTLRYLAEQAGMLSGAHALTPTGARAKIALRTPEQIEAEEAAERERARAIWHGAEKDTHATVLATYWQARGLTLPIPPTIRFAPALPWREYDAAGVMQRHTGPAMVAALRAPDAAGRPVIVGVHRTWLAADGTGKANLSPAKKMRGRAWGAAIHLAPVGEDLLIGEGIETAATGQQQLNIPAWAAGSLGNISGSAIGDWRPHSTRPGVRVPPVSPDLQRPGILIPPQVRRVWILCDGDSDPEITAAHIECACRRWHRPDLTIKQLWAPPGQDWNDVLRQGKAA